MLEFLNLAQQCAPTVHPDTLTRLVTVESAFNPFAIGVVKGKLYRQPRTLVEAKAAISWLDARGYNYSLGLSQVNKKNLQAHGLTTDSVFDPCQNIRAGGEILTDCYKSATTRGEGAQKAVRDALSCYYSGSLSRGYKLGYVSKIENASNRPQAVKYIVPALNGDASDGVIVASTANSNNAHSVTIGETTPLSGQERSALLF